MRTHIIAGKPLEDVTIKVDGQSLTLTAGVEVTIIVVVASQQNVQRTWRDERHAMACAINDGSNVCDCGVDSPSR